MALQKVIQYLLIKMNVYTCIFNNTLYVWSQQEIGNQDFMLSKTKNILQSKKVLIYLKLNQKITQQNFFGANKLISPLKARN